MKQPVLYIRPSAALKARLEAVAAANGRTVNKEVIRRLERSLEGWKQ
jgi:hypothetical protein